MRVCHAPQKPEFLRFWAEIRRKLRMEPRSAEIIHDFPHLFRVLAGGDVDRYEKHDFLPPSPHPECGVVSKDVVYSPEKKLSARLYLPETPPSSPSPSKLPLLIYIHGGAFSIQSAFSSFYHPYANSLAATSNSIVFSIEYRLAPEHPIPACYDDSYEALQWLSSQSQSEPWLTQFADFNRVYIAGDSAGANIAHDMVFRSTSTPGFKFAGLILIHPFFGREKKDKLWDFICPEKSEESEFRLNPMVDPGRLSRLGCERVLICIAEKDFIRDRGWNYYEGLKKSGWKGTVELVETAGEGHVFHLFNRDCDNAIALMNRVSEFISGGGRGRI